MLIKYGSYIQYVSADENGENSTPVTVSDYIFQELETDNLSFQNSLLNNILKEYKQLSNEAATDAEKHFLNHPDIAISQTVADLVTDKYTLSKIHSKFRELETDDKRLNELAPRYIYEYKLALIMNKRREMLLEMKKAASQNNTTLVNQIMDEIVKIDYFKNILSKELDRVLNML